VKRLPMQRVVTLIATDGPAGSAGFLPVNWLHAQQTDFSQLFSGVSQVPCIVREGESYFAFAHD
jgi:hypothetical protein